MIYNKVLQDSIERERKGIDYIYEKSDKLILQRMLEQINKCYSTDFHFLAEIDAFSIPGSGEIMVQYLNQFQSESVRSYLILQIVSDRVKDCASIVLSAYLHFKNSEEYIPKLGEPAPAHIYVRYDNAFRKLKSKKLKKDLTLLACNPRDAFYLPFTMRMLASWKIQDLERVFYSYLDSETITHESVGLPEQSENFKPSLTYIRRELKITAINCLRYYPSENTRKLIDCCMNDPDKDICSAAKKTLQILKKERL